MMTESRWYLSTVTLLTLVTAPLAAQGFGTALAVGSDEIVFAGEPLTEAAPGAVYVYRRSASGWAEAARLVADDGAAGDRFGRAIGSTGSTIIVGATAGGEGRGAAYVFTANRDGTWRQVQRLTASDGIDGDAFGRAVALDGQRALIATWGHGDGRGAVYVFERGENGQWSETAKLMAGDTEAGDWFGTSLAIHGDWVAVGAAAKNQRTGQAYLFRHAEDGTWTERAQLTGPNTEANAGFGSAIALRDGEVLVGAPGHADRVGAAFVFRYREQSGGWAPVAQLQPFDGQPRSGFGIAVALDDDGAWVGAPGAGSAPRAGEGQLYRFRRNADGWLTSVERFGATDLQGGDGFGATLALGQAVAVVGLPGDDFGAGTAVVLARDAQGWTDRGKIFSEIRGFDAVLGGQVDCRDGAASGFACADVDLVSFLPIQQMGGARGVRLNDVWGWTDPETGREYALVGRLDGTSFVDVTDPYQPQYLGNLPKTSASPPSTWRDIKVYRDHAYIVADGAAQHGMQVFDLRQLRTVRNAPVTFTETAHYDEIASAHNIVINEETGYAFAVGARSGGETCGGGLHMINIQDPARPTFAGCFADAQTGRASTGYSHDAMCINYQGPDEAHQGKEICFGANETALSIADVTQKDIPVALARASYPNVGYSHQGWITEDHRYFFMNDELDEINGSVTGTRTLIWDVTDLDDPILVREYMSDNKSSDHNLYIKGDYMYQSNYVSGLRVYDISDPENPRPAGFFDTVPYGEDAPGFNGSWSNYPYFDSGVVVVTSGREGLFVLKKRDVTLIP